MMNSGTLIRDSALLRSVVTAATVLVAPFTCPGSTVDQALLEDFVRDVAIIARVRILDWEPIEFSQEGAPITCGVRYRASILESFKGPTGAVTFLSSAAECPTGQNVEYLVFLYDRAPEYTELLSRRAEMTSDDYLECQLQERLFTREYFQMLLPIVRPDQNDPQEWLQVSRRSMVLDERFRQRSGADGSTLVAWKNVKRVVEATISEGDSSRRTKP